MDESRQQVRRLMIAIERIDQAYYRAQRRLGIKDAAFVLFYAIADGGTYSQKQICQEWSLPRTTLNTVVQEYVGKGYLRLAATGHKEKEVVLTPAGRAYVQEILAPVFAAEERVMAAFLHTDLTAQTEAFAQRLEEEFAPIGPIQKGEEDG